MNDLFNQIEKIGVVPVLKIDDISKAVPTADALSKGGLNCAEITFRTEAAEEAIKQIRLAFPKMLIGAGTVLNTEQVDKAINAGADFIVSPGFNPKTVQYCNRNNITIIPGCITPTEIEAAIDAGLSVVKFFPAQKYGGLSTIKALSAPFSQIRFMPTGGITLDNLAEYLKFNKIVACGGSFMASDDFEEVTKISAKAVELVRSVRNG